MRQVSFVKDVIDEIIKDRRNPIFHGHGAPNTTRMLCTSNFLANLLLISYFFFLSGFFFQLVKRVARKDVRRAKCIW